MKTPPLPEDFYSGPDVETIARRLIGCVLATRLNGVLTRGRIVETEAYGGHHDRASHAWNGRRTARTEPMFGPPGHAYVYLCYGLHALFNIVALPEGQPAAVLIRAIEPLDGITTMCRRRGMKKPSPRLTAGPGALTRALGITLAHNRTRLTRPHSIWVEAPAQPIPDSVIACGTRVGVGYAGPSARLPWRFVLKSNPWISPARGTCGDRPTPIISA